MRAVHPFATSDLPVLATNAPVRLSPPQTDVTMSKYQTCVSSSVSLCARTRPPDIILVTQADYALVNARRITLPVPDATTQRRH